MRQSKAYVNWKATRSDARALQSGPDWSDLQQVHGLWPQLSASYGDRPALDAPHASPPERFTYGELSEAIRNTRAALQSLDLGIGDVVALLADNGPRWLIADQGVMSSGAADAVRGSAAPVSELQYIIRDCGACGLILQDRTLLERLQLDDATLPSLRFVVLLSDEEPPAHFPTKVLSWTQLQELGQQQASPSAAAVLSGESLATILYTSGTTGKPKGVPLCHRNIIYQVQQLGVTVQAQPGERYLSVLPIWHSYERAAGYYMLSLGCQQTYTSIRDLRDDLQAVKPQLLTSVPRIWEALLGGFENVLRQQSPSSQRFVGGALACSRFHCEQWRTWRDLHPYPCNPLQRAAGLLAATLTLPLHRLAAKLLWPKVRSKLTGGQLNLAISGGGALSQHVDGFFEAIGIELLVGYGLTETSPVLTTRRRWANRRGSAGQPLPGTEIRIVATDQPPGEARDVMNWCEQGTVQARGPQVMEEYHNRPEATAKVLSQDGWFDTGDLGYLLPDGSLFLTGRAKDTIVLSNGENIEPTPLEDALLSHPAVEQVMLVGQDQRTLAALVVPSSSSQEKSASGDNAANDHEALEALRKQLNELLRQRRGARPDERLSAIAFVPPFTVENGLLTLTLKQRRDRIATEHQQLIESFYRQRGLIEVMPR